MSLHRRTESTTDILDDNDANIWTNREKKAKKFIKYSFFINVFLLVVLVGLLIAKTYLLERDRDSKPERDVEYNTATSDNGVCVPCNYLGPEVKPEDTLFETIEKHEGGKICCHKDKSYLQTMISRMMDPMITKPIPDIDHDVDINMKWWRKRQNAFHMYLDLDALVKTNENDYKNLVWTTIGDQLGTSFIGKGVDFNKTDQTVIVGESGVYFIYSAVTFDFGDVTSVATYVHKIDQYHPITPTTPRPKLSINRFGGSSETKRLYTSFVCGTFKLDGGLHLNSTISRGAMAHVKKSKYSSYFGMFKM